MAQVLLGGASAADVSAKIDVLIVACTDDADAAAKGAAGLLDDAKIVTVG